MTRSVKLIQEAKPVSYIYTSKTTPEPPSLEPTNSQELSPTMQTSFLRSFTKGEATTDETDTKNYNDEEYFPKHDESDSESESPRTLLEDDYLVGYNLERDRDVEVETDKTKDNSRHNHPFLFDSHDYGHAGSHEQTEEKFDSRDSKDEYEEKDEIVNNSSNGKDTPGGDAASIEKESVQNYISSDNGSWTPKDNVETSLADLLNNAEGFNKGNLATKEKVSSSKESVFSIEIPIYSNRNNSIGGGADLADSTSDKESDQEDKEVGTEKEISKELKNGDNLNATSTIDNKLQGDLNLSEEQMNQKEIENDGIEIIELPSDTDMIKTIDNERFHKTILHTALFHLDEENRERKIKPAATAIIIEDQDIEDSTPTAYGENKNHEFDEGLQVRDEIRKHKVKMLKNDQVMNMKATYDPERAKSSANPVANESVKNGNDVSESHYNDRKKILRSRNRVLQGAKNKTTTDWRLRLRVHNQNYRDNLENRKNEANPSNQPTTAQSKLSELQPTLGETATTKLFEEKPRLLSTSSFLPSFESFLKSILSNVQHANGKTGNNNALNTDTSKPSIQQVPFTSFGTSFANSLDHLLPSTSTTIPSPFLNLEPTQFRKRTFNSQHDLFDFPSSIPTASPPQADNYFDRLLGQFPTVGAIGSPSATGASLSNYQSPIFPTFPSVSPNFQYDINPGSTNDSPQLAPGVIPLDLVSSYIPVGLGLSNFQRPSSGQSSTNPYNNYNFGDFSAQSFPTAATNPASHLQPFGGIGTLTTSAGQPPTYNSISQGIHLLNLISGTVPNSYYHDQVYHSSQTTPTNFQSEPFTISPSLHFGTTAPTSIPDFSTSTNDVFPKQSFDFSNLANIHTPPPPSPPTFPLLSHDFQQEESSHARHQPSSGGLPLPFIQRGLGLSPKSDREALQKFLDEDEHDQEPAASSFSQSILTAYKKPKQKKKHKNQERTTTAGSIISLMTKPKIGTTTMFKTTTPKTTSSPKSFSFEIIPQRNHPFPNYMSPFTNKIIFDGDNEVLSLDENANSTPDDGSSGRSKKKSSANLIMPVWKTFPASRNTNISTIDVDPRSSYYPEVSSSNLSKTMPITAAKVLSERKNRKSPSAAGLKSGFFI